MSSGLLSFLRIGDATAGSIKSGGTTRRAAKMVILDVDHPDIEEFIFWKAEEESKVAALHAGARLLREAAAEIRKAVADAGNDPAPNAPLAAAMRSAVAAGMPAALVDALRRPPDSEIPAMEIGSDRKSV